MNNTPLIFKDHSHTHFLTLNKHVFEHLRSWNAVIVDVLDGISAEIGRSDPHDSHLILWFILNGGYQFHYLIDIWGVDIVEYYHENREWKDRYEGVANIMAYIFLGCPIKVYTDSIAESSEYFNTVKRTAPNHSYETMFTQTVQRSDVWREFVTSEKKKFKKFLSQLSAFLRGETKEFPSGFYLGDNRRKCFRDRDDIIASMSQKYNNTRGKRHYPYKSFYKLSQHHVVKGIDAFHKNSALCHYLLKRSAKKERCLAHVLVDSVPEPFEPEKFVLLLNVPETLSEQLATENLMFYARLIWHLSFMQMGIGEVQSLDFAPIIHPDIYIDSMVKNNQEMLDRVRVSDPVADASRRAKIVKNYAVASTWELVARRNTSANKSFPICNFIDFGFNTKDSFVDPVAYRTTNFVPVVKGFLHNYHTKVGNSLVGLSQYHLLTYEPATSKAGDLYTLMLKYLESVDVKHLSEAVRRLYGSTGVDRAVQANPVVVVVANVTPSVETRREESQSSGEIPPTNSPRNESTIVREPEENITTVGSVTENNDTTDVNQSRVEPMVVSEDDGKVQEDLARKSVATIQEPIVVLVQINEGPQPPPKSQPVVSAPKPNAIYSEDDEKSDEEFDIDAPVGGEDDYENSQRSAPAMGSQPMDKSASQSELLDEVMQQERSQAASQEYSLDGFVGSQNSNSSSFVNSRYGARDNDPQRPYLAFERALEYWTAKVTETFGLKRFIEDKTELARINARQNSVMVAFETNEGGLESGYISLEEMRLMTNIYRIVGGDVMRKLCFTEAVTESVLNAVMVNKKPSIGTTVNTMRTLLNKEFADESEMYPRVADHDDGPFFFDLVVDVCTYADFKKVRETSQPNDTMETFLEALQTQSKKTKDALGDIEMKTTDLGIFKRLISKLWKVTPDENDKKEEEAQTIATDEEKDVDDDGEDGSYVSDSFGGSFARLRQQIFMQLADACALPATKIPSNAVVDDDSMLFLEKLAFLDQDDSIRNQIFKDSNEIIEEFKANWNDIKLRCTYDYNTLLWCVAKVFSPLTHEDPYFKNAIQLFKQLFHDNALKVSDIDLNDKNVSLVYSVEVADVGDTSRSGIDEKRQVVIKAMMIFDGMMFNTQDEEINTVPLPLLQNVEYLIKETIKSFVTEPDGVLGRTRGSRNIWQSCIDAAAGHRPYSTTEADENPLWFVNLWRSPTAGEIVYTGDEQLATRPKMYQLFYHQNCSGTVQIAKDMLRKNADSFWLFMESLYFLGVRCNWFKFTQVFYTIIFDVMDGNGAWDMPYIGGNKRVHKDKTEAIVPGYFLWTMLRKANEHSSQRKSSSVIKKLVESSVYTLLQHYHFMIAAGDKISFPVQLKGGIDCESLKMVSPFTLDTFGDRPIEPSIFFDDGDEHVKKHWIESVVKRRRLGTSIHGTSGGSSVINPSGTEQDYYFPLLSANVIPRK